MFWGSAKVIEVGWSSVVLNHQTIFCLQWYLQRHTPNVYRKLNGKVWGFNGAYTVQEGNKNIIYKNPIYNNTVVVD